MPERKTDSGAGRRRRAPGGGVDSPSLNSERERRLEIGPNEDQECRAPDPLKRVRAVNMGRPAGCPG